MSRRRLDHELVRRELAENRSQAQELIQSGRVLVRAMPTPKPASLVSADTPIEITESGKRWVSRGALKLLYAFESFPISVQGRPALDVGASTGGFTEVLLAKGASSVLALDVGRGQLHERLRADVRVESRERTNFRGVEPTEIGAPFSLIVADLSFISLCTVANKLAECSAPGSDLIVLVKPQFEAGRAQVGKGGLVRDPAARAAAVKRVIECMDQAGLGAQGLAESPITGADGNVEYLLWLRKGEQRRADLEVPQ